MGSQQKWLPPPSPGHPLSPNSILPQDAYVFSLILTDAGIWNKPLIDRIFNPGDAQLITSLALSMRSEDKLI